MQQKFSLKLLPSEAADERKIRKTLSETSGKKIEEISGFHVLKKSIDARGKTVWVNLTVNAFINVPFESRHLRQFNFKEVTHAGKKL